jgi:uncharacterized repeat protein (TIGR02543 family)
LTVTQTASTATTATLSWVLEYVAHGYAASTSGVAKSYSVVIAGQTVKSGTYDINGRTGTTTIASGTKTITKTTAAQTISFSCSMAFNLTWSGVYGGTKSASGSISVSAKTSHKVTYNANGGSGAPSAQTKWHGTAITLSSTKPTRTGYTFKGWATSASGSVAYAAGASYSSDAAVTLYAVWQAITYPVTYNANGGTGAPANQTKTYGTTLTLSSTKPTRTNYTFKGWGTSASATTVAYAAGASYTANAALTLYAIWKLAYLAPRITDFTVNRCNASGTASDEGTNAKVSFKWGCDKTVSSITIKWKITTATTWQSKTVTASGTSGTVSTVIGSDGISGEYAYDIQVVVSDSLGSSTQTRTLDGFYFLLDFLADGTGVAIGKAATVPNAFDVYKRTIIRGNEDASGTTESGQFIVGDPLGYHVAMDSNEIMAKQNATTPYNLIINGEGGNVGIGGSDSKISLNGTVYMKNGKAFYGTNAGGNNRSLMQLNANNQYMFGYGGYSSNEGESYFDGNAVNIRSKGAIAITSPTAGLTARNYGVNKVLWSGARYMTADHTNNLSEAVSAQPNGVILVWSSYANGAAENSSFYSFFVPKHFVSAHGGCGMYFSGNGRYQHFAKYLYINNSTITGFAENNKNVSVGGVTIRNDLFVLRYVIGV